MTKKSRFCCPIRIQNRVNHIELFLYLFFIKNIQYNFILFLCFWMARRLRMLWSMGAGAVMRTVRAAKVLMMRAMMRAMGTSVR